MNSLNIAYRTFGFPNGESNTAAPSVGVSSSFSQVRAPGRFLETATQIVASVETEQFALQGNAAQFVVQRNKRMSSSDELTDAKIAAVEAHTDTKVERLGGKIDVLATTIVGKIESLKDDVSKLKENMKDDVSKLKDDISKSDQYNHDTRLVLISTFVVGFLALAGLFVALATYGDALFGRGMSVRDVVQTVIKEQQEIQKRDTTQHQPHN